MKPLAPNVMARALRLPFITASVLPFIAGSILPKEELHWWVFLIGLVAVAATHLSANLLNDYADSRSGADWQDRTYHGGLFGGSKLIQEYVLKEGFFLRGAALCAAIALAMILILALIMHSAALIIWYALVLFLAWGYSEAPFRFSYYGLGELVVFGLFGPAPVLAAFFLQTGRFPAAPALLLSLPFGFLTAAILLANEVPDCRTDEMTGKRNLVVRIGRDNAYKLYYWIMGAALVAVALNVAAGVISPWGLLAFVIVGPVFLAGEVLRGNTAKNRQLMVSSRLTIASHTIAAVILIVAAIS
jgi:1,4-dihydroxy-2-naphthoate octaprenyltransferase